MTTTSPAAGTVDGSGGRKTTVAQPPSMRRASAPVAAAAAAKVGCIAALLVIGVGVVVVRDAVLAAGWIAGREWLPAALAYLDGLTPAAWMTVAAVGVGALGVLSIVAAVAPRRTTAVPLEAESAVYLRRADVATVSAAAARDVPGVLSARSSVTRRKVVLQCRVTSLDSGIRARIASAVGSETVALQHLPKVAVRVKEVR